jgi:hypothetical protein
MQTDLYILHIAGATGADVANLLLALVPFVLMSGVALLYVLPLKRGDRTRRARPASRSRWDEPV